MVGSRIHCHGLGRPFYTIAQEHLLHEREVSWRYSTSHAVDTHIRQYLGRGTPEQAAKCMQNLRIPYLELLRHQSTRPRRPWRLGDGIKQLNGCN